ncbi:MAG: OsmC family protein [Promicromonosporaceae bacterium]|nr:OsmC family protein [Promicromonosporaceae bacterium]
MELTFSAKAKKIDDGMRVETTTRDFTLLIDEPPALGGTDTGMTPVEAVICALGACQTIVAFAFAEAQGIDLRGFHVTVDADLNTDGFFGKDPNVRNGFTEVRYEMHFEGPHSQEEFEKFAAYIEAHCPVGDIIANPTPIIRTGVVVHN